MTDFAARSSAARDLAFSKVGQIRAINRRMRILALNALIEAGRVGEAGRGFAVVSNEVRGISDEVEGLSQSLESELAAQIVALSEMAAAMEETAQSARLIDLALNAIEIIDRNLYERTCDVRWWATDSAFVDAATTPSAAAAAHAAERLQVILRAYTVYLDLWLCDLDGRVIASARGDRWALTGQSVSDESWFKAARGLPSGDHFHVENIRREPRLGDAVVATYATAVRAGGQASGRPVGVLAVHFDWAPQAQTVVDGVRLSERERAGGRVLLLDAEGRVLAASDRRGVLSERISLDAKGRQNGTTVSGTSQIAFHATPGYETYQGLGWYGAIVQPVRGR